MRDSNNRRPFNLLGTSSEQPRRGPPLSLVNTHLRAIPPPTHRNLNLAAQSFPILPAPGTRLHQQINFTSIVTRLPFHQRIATDPNGVMWC